MEQWPNGVRSYSTSLMYLTVHGSPLPLFTSTIDGLVGRLSGAAARQCVSSRSLTIAQRAYAVVTVGLQYLNCTLLGQELENREVVRFILPCVCSNKRFLHSRSYQLSYRNLASFPYPSSELNITERR